LFSLVSLFIYWIILGVVVALQALPLRVVVFLGRVGGSISWIFNRRHRNVVIENLTAAFPAKSTAEILTLGRENTRRIGENYAAAVKTASMPLEQILQRCEVTGLDKLPTFTVPGSAPRNCIVAIGHFGNFELYALLGRVVPGVRPATTYRGLKDARLSSIMQRLRANSGCEFFERRTDANALKEALSKGGLLLGLLSDQHINRGGVWVPFMGRHCSTTPAPALLALRYDAPLFTAICFRTAPGRWRIEIGDQIPTHEDTTPRAITAITGEINEAFEKAVRKDPANWFWVHKRWKPQKPLPNAKVPLSSDAPAADLVAEPVSL
jgi:lauroyl/myristoyl acyltransferase